jgi:hypothetical protein
MHIRAGRPGFTVACRPLELEINRGDASDEQVEAVLEGARRYSEVTDRDVVFLGETDAAVTAGDRAPDRPVLIEFSWPDDAPTAYGFAEPVIVDDHYLGGYVLIHPMLAGAPAEMVTRLTMHELGHLAGLADVAAPDEIMNPDLVVDDWGAGDIWGLHLTHAGC